VSPPTVQHCHPHRDAVRHLLQDHRLRAVRHRESISTPGSGPRVHHETVPLRELEPLRCESEEVVVLPTVGSSSFLGARAGCVASSRRPHRRSRPPCAGRPDSRVCPFRAGSGSAARPPEQSPHPIEERMFERTTRECWSRPRWPQPAFKAAALQPDREASRRACVGCSCAHRPR